MSEQTKKTLLKWLFRLSFLPALAVLVLGVINAIEGTSFIFNRIYGYDAFVLTLFACFYGGSTIVPIFPICVLFQLAYLIYPRFLRGKLEGRKFAKIVASLILLICLGYLVFYLVPVAGDAVTRLKLKKLAAGAEERIPFNTNEIFADGIMDLKEFRTDTLLLDYDTHTVGLVINIGYDEFLSFRLKQGVDRDAVYRELKEKYILQCDISLQNGGRFYAFAPSADCEYMTIALLWEDPDGTVWLLDGLDKDETHSVFTGLDQLKWEENRQ